MLLSRSELAAMLLLLFVRSSIGSSTSSPSPSLSVSQSSSLSSSMNSSRKTPSPPAVSTSSPGSSPHTPRSSSVGGRGQAGTTISPSASGAQSVSQMSSASVPDVEWTEWKTEKPSDCKEKCCDTGGPFLRQRRNCTIHRPRCNLTKCENYGVVERDISCYTVCSDCMPSRNSGYIMAAPGFKTIISALFILVVVFARA